MKYANRSLSLSYCMSKHGPRDITFFLAVFEEDCGQQAGHALLMRAVVTTLSVRCMALIDTPRSRDVVQKMFEALLMTTVPFEMGHREGLPR